MVKTLFLLCFLLLLFSSGKLNSTHVKMRLIIHRFMSSDNCPSVMFSDDFSSDCCVFDDFPSDSHVF